jgi:hypothetical protein
MKFPIEGPNWSFNSLACNSNESNMEIADLGAVCGSERKAPE